MSPLDQVLVVLVQVDPLIPLPPLALSTGARVRPSLVLITRLEVVVGPLQELGSPACRVIVLGTTQVTLDTTQATLDVFLCMDPVVLIQGL